jgi:hypothetical protein
MAIDIESLRRPEEEDGEKVCAGDKSDYKGEDEDTRGLLKSRWEYGIFRTIYLPETEGNK